MDDSEYSERMREDWNARAREDAGYYVAFERRDQDEAEFLATATDLINGFEAELRRVPIADRRGWKAEMGAPVPFITAGLEAVSLGVVGFDVSPRVHQ